MVSFCVGGTSHPKDGVVGQLTASVEAVAGFLALAGIELPAAVVALIGAGINFSAPVFCAADPPADPHPTQDDLAAALNFGDPLHQFIAVDKYTQWFLSNYWYHICECTNGVTPSPPVLSPPGVSTNNPGLPSGPNQPCFTNTYSDSLDAPPAVNYRLDLTNKLLPTAGPSITGTVSIGNSVGLQMPVWPIPSTVSGFDSTGTVLAEDPGLPVDSGLQASFYTTNSSGVQLGNISLVQTRGDLARDVPVRIGMAGVWPAGATHYGIGDSALHDIGNTGKAQAFNIDIAGVCSGAPTENGCCPPDPTIDARLNQIIGYLTYLISQQQPATSIKWKDGLPHSGLSGSGRLSLATGVTGVRVEVTAVPPTSAITLGDPTFYWDMGFITPLAIDIPLRGQRIVFNPENFALPSQADGIAWTIPAGGVINLIELLPA